MMKFDMIYLLRADSEKFPFLSLPGAKTGVPQDAMLIHVGKLARKPFIEQLDATANGVGGSPSFEILVVFQIPDQVSDKPFADGSLVVRPAHERRMGVKDHLSAREMFLQPQH